MTISTMPKEAKKFEIQAYEKPADFQDLTKTHVPFSGHPQKHRHDPDKIVLVSDPYGGVTSYYEFNTEDISYVEELPTIVNMEEETITMVRIWVKRQSLGIRCTPFLVERL